MAFQNAITIQKALELIHEREYLLPAIQREFVWKTEQIERLFDSILSGYPIGSFLFWRVKRESAEQYQFYEFIRNFHERDAAHNPRADLKGASGPLTAVLDGQQRLTALYIGLRGSYAVRTKWKHWDSAGAFPVRHLYLNLLHDPAAGTAPEANHQFRFLTEKEVKEAPATEHWFPVSKVLDFKGPASIFDYLVDKGHAHNKQAGMLLFGLHDAITNKGLITAFVEEAQDLDKVLNIFIRVNSGGTTLSYSDLLLSIATAQWETRDAREDIHQLVDELNDIGQGFSFDKDFVLKAGLMLAGIQEVAFKVGNFNRKNMALIESRWDEISRALKTAVSLVASFGFNGVTLTSNNSVIPVAHYILKRGLGEKLVDGAAYKEERRTIRRWLLVSLLKGVFGDQADTVLRAMRAAIDESTDGFPSEDIAARMLRLNKSMRFETEEVEELLEGKYGQRQTFSTLALLYPSLDFRQLFHQDHIHARSLFRVKTLVAAGVPESQVARLQEMRDLIPNLQLLEGTPNQEKSDQPFDAWLAAHCPDADARRAYRERHYIPDVDLVLGNVAAFFEARRQLMAKRLHALLAEAPARSS